MMISTLLVSNICIMDVSISLLVGKIVVQDKKHLDLIVFLRQICVLNLCCGPDPPPRVPVTLTCSAFRAHKHSCWLKTPWETGHKSEDL